MYPFRVTPKAVNNFRELSNIPISWDSAKALLASYACEDDYSFTHDLRYVNIPSSIDGKFSAWLITSGDLIVNVVRYRAIKDKFPEAIARLSLPYNLSYNYRYMATGVTSDDEVLLGLNAEANFIFKLEDVSDVFQDMVDVDNSIRELNLVRIHDNNVA